MRKFFWLFALLATTAPAGAVEFDAQGYADFRLVLPGGERGWLEGGLGKLRYGKGQSDFQFAGAVGEGVVKFSPELFAVAVARVEPQQRTFFDLLESYVRYNPAASGAWSWSVKGGAFFAPFSLENTELGWAPYWTLTPSAINSWFGDELRTVGAEATAQWSTKAGTLTLMGSAFGVNDPAGVLMADRGWAMDDRPTGLFDYPRQPDATLILQGDTPPDRTPIFKEFDHRLGWYAGVSWDDAKQWHLELIRYDNDANPSAHEDDYFAWHTRFWDAGLSDHFGRYTVIAQALTGDTTVASVPGFSSTTDFESVYALLGWEHGEWRLAARGDLFRTRTQDTSGGSLLTSENGYALTASASWLPEDWLRLTAEVLSITSKRGERAIEGLSPQQTETQFQLSARFFWN